MISIEPVIRNIRANGYAQVYIRIIHRTVPAYISTSFTAAANQTKDKKLIDFSLIVEIAPTIKTYYDKLNKVNTTNWTVKEVVEYLHSDKDEISFTDYCAEYILDMKRHNRDNPAQNYQCAINSLKKYAGSSLNFSDITSNLLRDWIKSLENTARAKNLYPTCISTMFAAGQLKYNNYDKNIIRIVNQPFRAVKIPKNNPSEKKAVSRAILLKLFRADTSAAIKDTNTPRAKDVALLIFCLAGINVADLYYMDKSSRVGNKLIYNRHKTHSVREDKALMNITIPKQILPLFDKYEGAKRLFSFSETINSEKNFLKLTLMGLKELAELAGVTENITTYTFRHSSATIAQNKCGASTELVAFFLNHASAHKVTEGYIEKDFTPIDILNQKVINWVFHSRNIKKAFIYKTK